jgi:Holliday junction resolvase
MSHPSKVKGNTFERELVDEAKAAGLHAVRAFASNGKALGQAETVDLMVGKCRVQAKRRKKIAADFKVPEGADVVAFREDRGDTFVLLRWETFLEIAKKIWMP